jgi:hypothetical protein
MMLRALLAWCVLMVGAVLNGAFRVSVLNPRLGERLGHVISTIMLCALVLLLTGLLIGWIGPGSSRDGLRVGALWLALTLAFELGFGHFIAKKPWHVLLADYNVAAGRVWILVLLTTLFAPQLLGRARKVW